MYDLLVKERPWSARRSYDEIIQPARFFSCSKERKCHLPVLILISLRFEAQVRGDGSLEVTEVTLTPVDEDDEAFSEVPYQGPRFEELDGALQNEFLHYLDERGINRDLAIYLSALNFDKEQREYTSWLERVQKFVNKTD